MGFILLDSLSSLLSRKMWKTELLISFLVLVFSSLVSSFSLSAGVVPSFGKRITGPTCPPFQEYRRCGPVCEHTCDTLREEVCCEVACMAGCFCADGYIREKKDEEPKKCVPLHECRECPFFVLIHLN
ncbi:g-protein coupled receptor 98 [Trichonephila clavata]|uniref:G-protein coupled receptor 98 n=1 Tax=Trichonephila clavata TaxID=2740835 RepID=A0A8X6FQ80_TRICU|nr:g-protein coupled receptor 98 [Trichonephila clavata]